MMMSYLLYLLWGCSGAIDSPCSQARDCQSGYCYIPPKESTGTCSENKTKTIP